MEKSDSSQIVDPWTQIPPREFSERQQRLRQAAVAQGYDGVVVWSRGGAFMDMAQDVLYLTSHYSQLPYMGDELGNGNARSHGVCILPIDGPTTVVVDVPWWRRDLVVADEVRVSMDVEGAAAQAVRDLGLKDKRIALVGTSYMSAAAYLGFTGHLPAAVFVRADRLVERIRSVKSPAEINLIRQAANLGSRAMDAIISAAVPGSTEAEAVAEATRLLMAGGGAFYDAACGSGDYAHDYVTARLPSADPVRHLRAGDMFHVDFYGSYGGYLFDFARSRVVGDHPSPWQSDLAEASVECVETICSAIRPGMTAAEVYAVGAGWMKSSAVASSLPSSVTEPVGLAHFGHGLGMMWEMPWIAPNDKTVLERGMYLAIEVLLARPGFGGALFEEDGIVTETDFEILTNARKRWW